MSRLVVCAPAGVVHGAHRHRRVSRQRLMCKQSRVSEEMCGAPMQLVAKGSTALGAGTHRGAQPGDLLVMPPHKGRDSSQ